MLSRLGGKPGLETWPAVWPSVLWSTVAYVALFPVGVGYYARLVSGSTARPLFAHVAFRGTDAAKVRRLGREYAQRVLPATVRPRALEQIRLHPGQGDDAVVVDSKGAVVLDLTGYPTTVLPRRAQEAVLPPPKASTVPVSPPNRAGRPRKE